MLKENNNGSIFKTENVVVDANGKYSKDIDMNENDVYLFNFNTQ